jgi:uncharacterized membrane-anchored protein YjiN (DUF445 family)
MDNETKKKYLERLDSDKSYKERLDLIKNEVDRNKTRALAEDLYLKLVTGLAVLKKAVEEHPDKLAEVLEKRIPKEEKHK